MSVDMPAGVRAILASGETQSDVLRDALRQAFRATPRKERARLRAALPPAEIDYCGVRAYVDPRDNFTDLRIWLDGEPPEMTCLTALMDAVQGRNAFVLDVGANSGAYTLPLAAAAGPGSRVIAFEPNPAMIGRLGHNVMLNNLGQRVRIEGCALGAAPGEALLHLKANNYGEASFTPVKRRQRAGALTVPVRSLLDFVGEAEGHDVSVLKVDVEGHEMQAIGPLLDAGGWLPDLILIETAHADQWEVDLNAVLLSLGYASVFSAEDNTLFSRLEDAL